MISNISSIQSMLKSVNKKNVFAPFIQFMGVILACMSFFSYLFKTVMETYAIYVFVFMCLVFVVGTCVYLFILVKRPESLQSETYRLEEKKLNIISGKSERVRVNPVTITLGGMGIDQLEKGGDNE